MKQKENCVFCDKEKIETPIIYEDRYVMAFLDVDPINEGHILFISKEHYFDMDAIPDEVLCQIMIVCKKIIKVLKQIYNMDGYTVMQNGGKFNDVGHYHVHIIPRFINDGFGFTYGNNKRMMDESKVKKLINELR